VNPSATLHRAAATHTATHRHIAIATRNFFECKDAGIRKIQKIRLFFGIILRKTRAHAGARRCARLPIRQTPTRSAAMGRTCFITNILPGKMDECELHRHQLLSAGWAGWLARVTKLSAHSVGRVTSLCHCLHLQPALACLHCTCTLLARVHLPLTKPHLPCNSPYAQTGTTTTTSGQMWLQAFG
jgi:hypothetical protein